MKITQIRNATQIVEYAGKRFLIDPLLADKGAYPGFATTIRSEIRNPMVELPMPVEKILEGIDAVIVTHTHLDHWDDAAAKFIPKDMLIFVQNGEDHELLTSQGFTNLKILKPKLTTIGDVTLCRTSCQHGSEALYANPAAADFLGEVTGVIFKHSSEKTLYIVGDSIFTPIIASTMQRHKPDVVVLNTGWAHVLNFGPIICGREDLIRTHVVLPDAQILATHMGAINHCLVTRQDLLDYAKANELHDYVQAPADGETVIY